MRQERTVQTSVFDLFAEHEIGRELRAMSQWLDEHGDLLGLVTRDLRRHGLKETGREGLPAEAVLRCALLKQHRQLSYQELAFHLEDSASFRAFARLPWGWSPKKSVLHKTISAIRAQTFEEINRVLLASARQEKLESGKVLRVDSTVTAALIHEPSDSSLLWDAVRVMVRLLQQADALGSAIPWHDHRRAAKKRSRAIEYTRGRPKRIKYYRELLKITRTTLSYLQQASEQLPLTAGLAGELWQAQLRRYRPLIERIIAQTERRVLAGEAVPAGEKLVSLFEPHADIIVKGSRDVDYGHKLNLTTGRSGLILDLVVEAGNPADSERLQPMLERHIAFYGAAPRQAAADGGYASRTNLSQAKAWGIRDMAFHKKCGLKIEDMVKSRWVYRKLRNFRAGIEAGISCLKRAYGLGRCTWRGLDHFKAYVWSSVVAYNLALFARLRPT
ncbi:MULTISPECIES: ISNCY-like element ISRle10 family transposase [Rhizobium]|uniref:Transposase n=2 Tax=Rhizobium TaxID=379 RepID=Q1M9V0_RHIJ3|nr:MULTISPECIES: ISNCY-like element ISRle10 family transposase [Rhizobium]NEH95859.1 ISNCY-like element ISRle10 family transposase [Rhizobium laguerreae]NEJ81855.1 ISNCY-like element ISRle10 family transposase [Rhizobium leguminosarum]CAK09640.1 putative transposon-related protein [Rhizobium johnstonii 3841]CAK11605.1 putative transposase [Rhizobium johnstonii 3841]